MATVRTLEAGASSPYARKAMQRLLITLGIVLVLVGLMWPWLAKLPLFRLPGDIVIERPGFRFYFPITTSLLLSLLLSLILWWLTRR